MLNRCDTVTVMRAGLGRMRACGAVDAERERGVRKRAWARLDCHIHCMLSTISFCSMPAASR